MPYTIKTLKGDDARKQAVAAPPFGPGFNDKLAAQADSMVVTGSSFGDPGEDWVEFTLLGVDGQVQARRRVAGY